MHLAGVNMQSCTFAEIRNRYCGMILHLTTHHLSFSKTFITANYQDEALPALI